MKFILIVAFSLIICNVSFAQQAHFVYIQTENKQPFYLKTEGNIFNSTISGYLIIPKLTDGTHNISIGFPKNQWGEKSVSLLMDKKDIGFLLKNFGEKGWGLFNLQTLDILILGSQTKIDTNIVIDKSDDFSNMLAKVVNDPTIRQIEKPKEELNIVSKIDNQLQKTNSSIESKKNIESKIKKNVSATLLNKEVNSSNDLMLKYIIDYGDKIDTIDVFISAVEKLATNKTLENIEFSTSQKEIEKTQADDTISIPIPTITTSGKKEKFIENIKSTTIEKDILKEAQKEEDENKNNKIAPIVIDSKQNAIENDNRNNIDKAKQEPTASEIQETSVSNKLLIENSDCKFFASDEDFLKLRKKMASESMGDKMLSIAKKSFKSKCFSCEQIKNLSVLFLKDEGKYAFFDLSYPFVTDSHNFPHLQSQLTEDYYISRFKAMIKH